MRSAAVKSSGVVVPHSLKWHGRLAAFLIYMTIQLVAVTLRYRLQDKSGLITENPKAPLIFCSWHNRLSLSLIVYNKLIRSFLPTRRLAALVSASKDGGLLARILEHFGVQPVRGSTSRRGPQALLELTGWAERGHDLAITPDGPRGPSYVVQDGVMALAQLTGLGIVPVVYHLNWKFCLKSWDRFQIPIPFGKCEVVFGQPIYVPRAVSGEERAALRSKLEEQMRAMTSD
ncbi:MAG: DUF374 domain-containing protein [Pedosphaera sp.]|nr:DUF374 domain-containing protein [Pedosphaera sp.]